MAERITVNSKKPVSIKENLIFHKPKTDFQSDSSPVNQILYLQKTIGNQAVQRMVRSGALQAKLSIGQPGDVYEQEADRVADAVMRMPEPGVQREVEPEEEEEEETLQAKPLANQITPLVQVQRQEEPEEEEEMLQAKPLAEEITPLVQRQAEPEEEEEEEMLQAKSREDATSEVPEDLESQINAIRSGGRPLAESERAYFEPRFGHDFSKVRMHTDTQAAESAQAVNARAFTVGEDVVFGAGQYAPESSTGQRLMAHELTHVVQQNGGSTLLSTGKNSENTIPNTLKLDAMNPATTSVVQRQAFAGLSNRIVITNNSLNVRDSAPSGNIVETLKRGDIVEVQISPNPNWYRITNTTFTDSGGQQVDGYISASSRYSRPIGAQSTPRTYQQIVQDLVSDYNNITVFPAGQTTGGTTFGSPYVLNSGATVQAALATQRTIHRNLITRIPRPGGQPNQFLRVRDVTGTRQAFVGKGTPEAIQVIAQAAVDAGLTTSANIQTYINQGPWNSGHNRRNGRFGVDCSGFTAVAIAEMGGANRSAGPGLNIAATAYRPGGSAITRRGFSQVRVGEVTNAGDVIARMNTNHVMVLFGFRQINIPADAASTNPLVTGNRTAWKFLVGESTAARQAGNVGEVTDRKEFVSVPDAVTAGHAYYYTNRYNRVNSRGSNTWDLFKPTANHCWDLTPGGNLRIKNLNFVKEFSIVRPPSQRETTPVSELGT